MKFSRLTYLIYSDLYRSNKGKISFFQLLWNVLFGKTFKYNFWLRVCSFAKINFILKYSLFPFARLILRHYTYKFGITFSQNVTVGSGLFFGHFGGVIVNPKCIIGKNCNISQGVTIGQVNRGRNKGVPTIGNNVYIGPGAIIVGAITIGDNVAIGGNCVVTKSIENNAVVVGVPGKIISYDGSKGYVNKTDYDKILKKK